MRKACEPTKLVSMWSSMCCTPTSRVGTTDFEWGAVRAYDGKACMRMDDQHRTQHVLHP